MTTTRHGSAIIELPNDCEVKIRRAFEAPMSLVFDALTKPEHVRVWFSGDGTPLEVCEIDLRVGGEYHFAWHVKDRECSFRGTYMEVVRPTRTVETWVFEERPEFEAVETSSLTEDGGITTWTNVMVFKDRASRDGAFNGEFGGMQDAFDRLEDLLAARA